MIGLGGELYVFFMGLEAPVIISDCSITLFTGETALSSHTSI